ncbi:hypothetical protein [Peribacillus sp. FSL R5-0717]
MYGSLNKTKLIKNDLKGIAKLMYQDLSVDTREPNKEKFRFYY